MAAAMKYFTCLLILLCLSSLWLSSAQPLKTDGNATSELTTISKTQKGFTASASVGGRKMALDKVMRLAKVKPQGVSAGSNQVEGKFGSTQKMTYRGQKVNSKQTTAGRFSAKIDKAAGFVAFNADYGAPRHHPPKNN